MIEYVPQKPRTLTLVSGYNLFPKAPYIPIIKVNDLEIKYPTGYPTGYLSGGGQTTQPATGETVLPGQTKPGTLVNGKPIPAKYTTLYAGQEFTSYYRTANTNDRWSVTGKSWNECQRRRGEIVGLFTGETKLNEANGTSLMLQVETRFPFDEYANKVDTKYTLWVAAFVDYKDESITPDEGQTPGAGYATGDAAAGKKNANWLWIAAGALLLINAKK